MIQDEFKFYKPCKLLQLHVRIFFIISRNQQENNRKSRATPSA